MEDYIVRATAAEGQIRAFAITSRNLVEQARENHDTSPVITAALGRLLSGAAMMGTMMKGEKDLLTLQIEGSGPAKGLTVTADASGHVKGFPKVAVVELPPNAKGKLDVGGALGTGILSVIKDMGLKEPYVGQIALQTGEIAEDLTYYFATSEQVPSAVGLGVLVEKDGTVRQAGGFIIQLMPYTPEEIIDALEQTITQIPSVTEMLEQGRTPEQILEHILGSFGVEVTERIPASFRCDCSKERVSRALATLSRKDLDDIIGGGETIEVKCQFCDGIKEAAKQGAKVIVLPELCITGYTCSDLFWQKKLLDSAQDALAVLAERTAQYDCIWFAGLPFAYRGGLYNVAAAVSRGKILGLVPKTFLPNYNEFYEARHFTRGMEEPVTVELADGTRTCMGTNLIFCCQEMPELKIAAEICEDLWTPCPPSIRHALNGANVIVNLSASDETTGKDIYRRELVGGQSARLICGYVYCSAGDGESTQDVVYAGHNLIAENGQILVESKRFSNETVLSEVDVSRMEAERRRMTTYEARWDKYGFIPFLLNREETVLTRRIDPMPFVPGRLAEREKRCDEILSIQAMGLKKRMEHTGCKTAVVGISGGLDSTLALLVTVRAFDMLGMGRQGIKAVTMPGFGTTDRTYDNAVKLISCLHAQFEEVDIKEAVNIHFRDIGQNPSVHDVTYENGQARERTQILMDIANKTGGMVIGTGDLSELALGWATYNGDHMSMYAVNASVPKTLVRHLVRYYADTCGEEALKAVLLDVLDTPVSPELLPPEDGKISQKTEDLVGPYELHDFFLYYMLRQGFPPAKVFRLAKLAFGDTYGEETILKWLKIFYRRFFAQQFKRSCLPDGPKVGSVAVSPRGDLRMPSDACARIWLEELEQL